LDNFNAAHEALFKKLLNSENYFESRPDLSALLKGLLEKDPEKRLTSDEALACKWLSA
jgi:serine/threonine protein kinase